MEDIGERERGLESIVQSFTRTLECPLCFGDQTEQKILTCCDKLICSPCLDNLFDKDKNRQLQNGALPLCPMCQQEMTLKPEQYPVNKLAGHLQRYTQTLRRAVEKGCRDKCQTIKCKRDVDLHCKSCNKFICYRCKDKPCQTRDDQHDTVDITSCIEERREELSLWKSAKEGEIQAMKDERDKIGEEVNECGQQLALTSASSLADVIPKTLQLLSTTHDKLKELNGKISRESSSLQLMVDSTEHAGETEFIHLVSQLSVFEESRQIMLGEYEPIMKDVECFDVLIGKGGHLLVARKDGLDILNVSSGEKVKSLPIDGECSSIEIHKDSVIVSVNKAGVLSYKFSLVTLDGFYQQVSQWSASFGGCDFTILLDKVYVTTGNSRLSRNVEVFSLTGEKISEMMWNGNIIGITHTSPHFLVFGDKEQNRVYKKSVDSGAKAFEWGTDVKAPQCLCVDDNGLIWVWSNVENCLTILKRNGKRHQDDFTSITQSQTFANNGNINGVCVHRNHLYVAHKKGAGRFQITYV